MSSLMTALTEQLGGDTLRQLAGQAVGGAAGTPADLDRATSLALSSLFGGLSRNTAQPGGADSLLGALLRDHDGSLLDQLGGSGALGGIGGLLGSVLGGGGGSQTAGLSSSDGLAIVGHVFGQRQDDVAAGLGKRAGLDAGSMLRLLATFAPVVMAFLGREQRRQQFSGEGLAGLLGREQEQQQAAVGASGAGLLGALLDRDGDGQVADDLADLGGSLLSGLFSKR